MGKEDFSTDPDVTDCVVKTGEVIVGTGDGCTSDVDNLLLTAMFSVDISATSEVGF